MPRQTLLTLFAICALLHSASGPLAQQAYPARPVELVVPFQPGGGVDNMARTFADAARPHFSQPFVVVYRPGAASLIGLAYTANAPADGYKVAMISAELLTAPLMGVGKVSHTQFQPIAQFNSDPSTLAVRADSPWKTIDQFLDFAKINPGKVSIANAGAGSISHIAAAVLGRKTDAAFLDVPYQGSAPAVLSVLSGQVSATTANYSVLAPHVDAGKIRVLGVMSRNRFSALPDVPTFNEHNIDVVVDVWRGIAVKKETPKPIVDRLRQVAARVAEEPVLKEALRRQGLTFAYADSEAFSSMISREAEYYAAIVPQLELTGK